MKGVLGKARGCHERGGVGWGWGSVKGRGSVMGRSAVKCEEGCHEGNPPPHFWSQSRWYASYRNASLLRHLVNHLRTFTTSVQTT